MDAHCDAAGLLTKKKNGLTRFKISKLVKFILKLLLIKFYDSGSFTLAVIVKMTLSPVWLINN